MTAWNALVEFGQVRPDATVLALGTGGVAISALRIARSRLAPFPTTIGKSLTLRFITEGSRARLSELVKTVAANGIEPVIDREFAFTDAAAAYHYLKTGDHMGKVMVGL